MRRDKKKKWKSKETGEKRKRQKLIHTDKQTDGRTDRHKSFNDMEDNTE